MDFTVLNGYILNGYIITYIIALILLFDPQNLKYLLFDTQRKSLPPPGLGQQKIQQNEMNHETVW